MKKGMAPMAAAVIAVVSGCAVYRPVFPRPLPPGAAALGYTKCIIDEHPCAADIAPGKNGDYK